MSDILFLYSFKISIRFSGVNGLSLFDLCFLKKLIIQSYQFILFFCIVHFGELLKRYLTVFCRLFAFKKKLKPEIALKVSSRRYCRVIGKVFME